MSTDRAARAVAGLLILLLAAPAPADDADRLLTEARAAWARGEKDRALELAAKAIDAAPKQAAPRFFRGILHEALGRHEQAVADFTACVAIDPRNALAYDRRGSEQFKLGRIKESVEDFDRFLALMPREKPGHWKRGISLYYLGRFKEGREQFESYEQVDTNDVENAVWHFLCAAREQGVERARGAILKIGKDSRVPMMQVYALFQGKVRPDDVLKAAEAGSPPEELRRRQLFYAHLYLGLYHEVMGEPAPARKHIDLAAKEYRIGHYMGDVAHVHAQLLRKAPRP